MADPAWQRRCPSGPDFILMDTRLPVLGGYDATRQIKDSPDVKETPIIAVSSFAMKGSLAG
jgi:two-component system, cell cycle response regulator DivK